MVYAPSSSTNWIRDKQSIEVPNSRQPGYSGIYRNATVPELTTTETTYDLFAKGRELNPNGPCLGARPWDASIGDFAPRFEWITYAQVESLRTQIGSALTKWVVDGDLRPANTEGEVGYSAADKEIGGAVEKTGWTVGLWCNNRPEWQIVDQANAAHSRVTVALYDSYDPETSIYVLSHSEARVVFTTTSHIAALLAGAEQLPLLRVIVTLDNQSVFKPPPGDLRKDQLTKQWGAQRGIKVISWQEALDIGAANPAPHMPPKSNEVIASYCYTSGTTGKPKAAMISHRQIAGAAAAVNFHFEYIKSTMSYLPLAHIYQRLMEAYTLSKGVSIGYFCGDILRLLEDAQILKPESFISVPRVLNRIAAQIQASMAEPGLKGKLVRTAVETKLANLKQTGSWTHAFYDRLVFNKVRAVLGGNIKLIVSGSAPIRPDVLDLLKVGFCCSVQEGYGQTENTGCCIITLEGDPGDGTCGPPQPGLELRLKDCPELGYTSSDQPNPRGELLMRGHTIFSGYYKDEEKTRETIDADGWLQSGDVAEVDAKGRFRIIDRVKNLIKLAQGEYVAIEKVEGIFAGCPLVAQLWLYGDSLQAHLVAIAVPEPGTFATFASRITGKQVKADDPAGLEAACNDPKVVSAFILELAKTGRAARLNGFEMVRALKLRTEMFSVENGLLTPTLKMKRHEAAKLLKKDIDELYARPPADISAGASAKL